jgi:malonate transporter and related proteins
VLEVILDSTVPVFFVLALGYVAGRTKYIDNQSVAGLTSLVMDFALPASLFVAMAQTPRSQLLQDRALVAVLAASMLGIYGVSFVAQRTLFKLGAREAAAMSLTAAFPNLASAGFPVIGSVFGPGHIVTVAIALAVGSIVLSPLTLILLEAGDGTGADAPARPRLIRTIGKSIFKPVVIAPLFGVTLSLCHVEMPPLLDTSLGLIGVCAGGVALFLTGLILSAQPFKLNVTAASGTLLKNVGQPLFTAGLVIVLAAPPLISREAIILGAVPSGFFGILFSLRYRMASQNVGSTLIASTILSAATIPAAILLTPVQPTKASTPASHDSVSGEVPTSTVTVNNGTTSYSKDWGKDPVATLARGWRLNSDAWDGPASCPIRATPRAVGALEDCWAWVVPPQVGGVSPGSGGSLDVLFRSAAASTRSGVVKPSVNVP